MQANRLIQTERITLLWCVCLDINHTTENRGHLIITCFQLPMTRGEGGGVKEKNNNKTTKPQNQTGKPIRLSLRKDTTKYLLKYSFCTQTALMCTILLSVSTHLKCQLQAVCEIH